MLDWEKGPTALLEDLGILPGATFMERVRECVDSGLLDFRSLSIQLVLEFR
jgi:hypothetical protein